MACKYCVTADNVKLVDDIEHILLPGLNVSNMCFNISELMPLILVVLYTVNNAHGPFLSISPNMSFVFLVNCIKMEYGRG